MTDVQRAPDASSVDDLAADLWPPPAPAPASPPAQRGGSRVPMVVGGVVGALIGVAIARGALPWSGAQIGLGAIGAMLAIWPQMLVHEAGHVAFGWLGGMRAYLLGLGRLRLERTGRGWRGYRGARALGLGGFALMLPRDADFGRAAFCALGLGGVIANLAASAACVIAMDGFAPGQAWSPVLGGAAVTGFAMAVVNLVPFRHHGWSTDGMSLLQILRGDAMGRARFSAMRLLGLSYAGVRPRDWPPALMPETHGVEDPLMRAHIHALHLAFALDAGEAASAEARARELVAMFPVLPPVVRARWRLRSPATLPFCGATRRGSRPGCRCAPMDWPTIRRTANGSTPSGTRWRATSRPRASGLRARGVRIRPIAAARGCWRNCWTRWSSGSTREVGDTARHRTLFRAPGPVPSAKVRIGWIGEAAWRCCSRTCWW